MSAISQLLARFESVEDSIQFGTELKCIKQPRSYSVHIFGWVEPNKLKDLSMENFANLDNWRSDLSELGDLDTIKPFCKMKGDRIDKILVNGETFQFIRIDKTKRGDFAILANMVNHKRGSKVTIIEFISSSKGQVFSFFDIPKTEKKPVEDHVTYALVKIGSWSDNTGYTFIAGGLTDNGKAPNFKRSAQRRAEKTWYDGAVGSVLKKSDNLEVILKAAKKINPNVKASESDFDDLDYEVIRYIKV